MDNSIIQSIWTILVFITFVGIIFWAYSSSRKEEFDAAANSILNEDESETVTTPDPSISKNNYKETK